MTARIPVRMPLSTGAQFPLLYGWRSTRATAAAACVAVSSVDPSSTTSISRHGAAAAKSRTTAPIDAASLKAGITTDVSAASAISHQPLAISHECVHDAVPRDGPRALVAGVAERLRESRV